MSHVHLSLLALLGVTLVTACGGQTLESEVDQIIETDGRVFDDCGTETDVCNDAVYTCLAEHWNLCTPARATILIAGIDATFPTGFVIRERNGGCEVVVVTDHTRDSYMGDYDDITANQCDELAIGANPRTSCLGAQPAGCTDYALR